MKANNSKNTMFAKRVATMLVAIMMGVSAWGNETLTLLPGYSWGSGSGYKTGTGTLNTDAGHAIGLSWTNVMNSTGIQLAAKTGVLESTSCLSANHKIKSITINVSINTIKLYCSTDGSTWSDEISFTSGEAKNVSSSNYALFRVTSTTDYAKASSIVVEYVSTVPYTVTFDAQSGNCGTTSLDESEGGAGVQLPEATLSDALTTAGWSFFGWATTACAESTTTAPTIVGTTGDRYYPSSNETLYAVYKKNESTFSNDYHKISSVGALESGVDYVIADKYLTYNNALKAEEYDNTHSYYMAETAVTVTDDVISSPASSIVWNITKNNDGKVYLKNGSNYLYITYTGSHYNLKLASTIDNTNEEWFTPTFAEEDGALTLASQLYSSYSLQYNYYYGEFKSATSAGDGKIYVYKRQRNATYYSNPCDKFMSLTTVNTSTATLAIGASSIATCGGEMSRQVTITATPATGYTFISTSRLNYTGDGTAEYVSGPTPNGDDFDFVYQFSQSDNGDGEFSANASPKTYTITLNRNGGAGETQQVTATYNSATLSAAITVPEKEDYIFDGWYSEEGGNGELVISKTGALQANVTGYTGANGIWTKDAGTTLYAKWTMHSFVNYRTRCCDLDVVTNLAVSATTENSVMLTWSLPAVMDGIDNFRIVKASDGSTVVDNIDKNATSAIVSGLTECETYSYRVASVGGGCKNNSAIIEATPFEGAKTVTFDYNGGSGSMSEFVTACGAKTVTLPTPNDRDGYTFNGWYYGSDKIGNAGEDYTPTEDIMLKAQYTEIPRHSITLKAMGSNYKTIANKLEGSSVWTLIKDEKGPKMTGYAFIGWSVSENSTTVLTSGTAGTLDTDKTLHAVYQKAEYKYVKVTATSGITDGQYLIVYETGSVAFDGSLSTLDAVGNTISVDIDENEIAVSDDTEAAEFTIDATNGTVKSASGYYIGVSSNSNGLSAVTTAETFPHNLSIEEGSAVVAPIFEGSSMVLRFNDASNQNRFRYYSGSQEVIQLYKKTAILAPSTEVVVPTLTVANNQTVNADELYPDGVAGNIVVEVGGKLNVSDNLNVNNIFIESEACASGQVIGATNLHGNLYMDVTFFKGDNATTLDETTAARWYMISAPFDVNLSDGFTLTDGTAMHFGVDDNLYTFDLFEYDGKKRGETGVTGWKRVQGKMKAGTACLIGFNPGQPTTIRLKAASAVGEPESIELKEFTGDSYNQNWNGVANPTLHYTNIDQNVQVYENEDGDHGRKYNVYSASTYSFVVGTAFFVQATGSIGLEAASHSQFRAPKRESERYEACVQIFRQEATEFADQMYVRASEIASNEYEQGHDMITWNGTTGNTAMIWAENYGKRLAIEEAPLVSNQASYALGIFAPKTGTYRIAATSEDDADLYLTYEGAIIWNLSMGAYEIELAKGTTNGYGLLLQAKAPQVVTGVDEVDAETGVQKIIIDEHVFILRGGQMYDVTGKMVK